MIILKLLGTVDIVSGLAMVFPEIFLPICSIIGTILFLKGAYSFSSSLLAGYYYDAMGILDIAAGISLILIFNVPLLWLFMIVKGVASLF